MRLNGTRASSTRQDRSDRLVRQYLGQARKQNHDSQSYGGSTGGGKSFNPGQGIETLAARGKEIGSANQIFKEAGSGSLGARRSAFESRQLPELP
jgi:hypothetical protein